MRLSEVYTSVQGEGPNTGRATTFIRFGGCNLRCRGWGEGKLPDGTTVRGCDTVFAVYPEWRGTWNSVTVDQVLDQIPENPRRVCITGGEPLIQPTKEINELAERLVGLAYEIDLFTNGSRLLKNYPWTHIYDQVSVVMDWKLPGSEEQFTFEMSNLDHLTEKDAIKFVCKNAFDFESALGHIEDAGDRLKAQVWFGPVWGYLDPSDLASWISRHYPQGRMNLQTHKYIWDPEERKV